MDAQLLPANATAVERASSRAIDISDVLGAAVTAFKLFRAKPLTPAARRALMVECGLNPLLQFGVSEDQAWNLGRGFLDRRGTRACVALGLRMLSTSGTVEESPLRRRRWNRFQLGLGTLPPDDVPALRNLAGLVQFSVAERSRFVRGYKFYDVRAAETSRSRLSRAMLSDSSGVRLDDNPVKWSFGRPHDAVLDMTQAELAALGVWIAASTAPFSWARANFPWTMATFSWGGPVNEMRHALMAALLSQKSCWIEFRTTSGGVIGYARARAIHQVLPGAAGRGAYQADGQFWIKAPPTAPYLYVEAMTGFGDGLGSTAASLGLRFGAAPLAPLKPGALWAGPGQLDLPLPAVCVRVVSIPFRRTFRECLRFVLRFTV